MMPSSAGVASTSRVTTRVTSHQPASSARVAGPRTSRRAQGTFTRPFSRERSRRSRLPLAAAAGQRDAVLGQPVHRVLLVAVLAAGADLEVQVVAGALAEIADRADELARLHLLTDLHEDLLLVAVDGDGAVRVLDHDE